MRKTTVLLTFVLAFAFTVPAYTQNQDSSKATDLTKDLNLPNDYKQWPNVFQRHWKIDDKHTHFYTMWLKRYKDSLELLIVLEINKTIIQISHRTFRTDSNGINQSLTEFWLIGDVLKLETESQAFEPFRETIRNKFGLSFDQVFAPLFGDKEAAEDLERFMQNAVLSEKPN